MDVRLMGLLSRWTAPSREAHAAVLLPWRRWGRGGDGGRGVKCGWLSRSSRGHSSDAMHQTYMEGIIWQHLTAVLGALRVMQNKCQAWVFFFLFFFFIFLQARFIRAERFSRRLCKAQPLCFIKEARGRWGERPRCFLKDPLKGFRESQLVLWSTLTAAASCLIAVERQYQPWWAALPPHIYSLLL